MNVELKQCSDVALAVEAALICTGNDDKVAQYLDHSQRRGEQLLMSLIRRGHHSVFEHLVYTFKIDGVSRALLQELARHRHISLSVLSTRWALKKMESLRTVLPHDVASYANGQHFIPAEAQGLLKEGQYIRLIGQVLQACLQLLKEVEDAKALLPNDVLKYFLPECVPTRLLLTTNLRELRHIYALRHAPEALAEFRNLMAAIRDSLPESHRQLLIYGIEAQKAEEVGGSADAAY